MTSHIENQTKKATKLPIEPIYDTNWCDMPEDIKSKCIGKMELNERLSLRCTAKAERSLVDSQKIEFYKGEFLTFAGGLDFSFYKDKEHKISKRFKNEKEPFKFLNYISNVGVFDNLIISFDEWGEFEKYTGEISARNVDLENSSNFMVVPILQKIKDGVESIMMYCDGGFDYIINKIISFSQVQNANYWHIQKYNSTDSLCNVAQMWINKKSKMGSTFQVSVIEYGSFNSFLNGFAHRLVSKSQERVRIRTDNPDHHILLECGTDASLGITFIDQYFRLMVISAEMKESEYDEDCKQWISKMAPKKYYN